MPDEPRLDDAVYDGSVRPVPEPGRGQRLALLIIGPLALGFAAVLLVFYVLYTATVVDGPSMLETLHSADRLLVTKSYPEPHRGDIVVAYITGQDGRPDEVVKRVVAIAGDTVEIKDDAAIVNGAELTWPGVLRTPGAGDTIPPQRVPEGTVFLMGDNRPVSYDSRYVGPVPLANVYGKAVFIFAPLPRMGRVN